MPIAHCTTTGRRTAVSSKREGLGMGWKPTVGALKMRSFTSNSNGTEPAFLGSIPSIASFRFKFPATTPSTVQFAGNRPIKAKAFVAAAAASFTPSTSNESGPSLIGRRAILHMSTMPFLVGNDKFGIGKGVGDVANAADESLYMKEEIRKVLSKGKAAGVLRLVFHDAGTFDINEKTGGMNGSVVYELDRPENKGLKKSVKILEKAKSQIDVLQPVSWADMIAVAGAVAVSLCGGPYIVVQLGRTDSMVPDPEGRLPEETLDAPGLRQCFQRKGFSTQELVALSGAHTLGSKGFGDPFVFDNSYFKILLEKPWLSSAGMSAMIGLPSDRTLVEDDECNRWISRYADNQDLFFEDFKNVYIKLVNTGASWRTL